MSGRAGLETGGWFDEQFLKQLLSSDLETASHQVLLLGSRPDPSHHAEGGRRGEALASRVTWTPVQV